MTTEMEGSPHFEALMEFLFFGILMRIGTCSCSFPHRRVLSRNSTAKRAPARYHVLDHFRRDIPFLGSSSACNLRLVFACATFLEAESPLTLLSPPSPLWLKGLPFSNFGINVRVSLSPLTISHYLHTTHIPINNDTNRQLAHRKPTRKNHRPSSIPWRRQTTPQLLLVDCEFSRC